MIGREGRHVAHQLLVLPSCQPPNTRSSCPVGGEVTVGFSPFPLVHRPDHPQGLVHRPDHSPPEVQSSRLRGEWEGGLCQVAKIGRGRPLPSAALSLCGAPASKSAPSHFCRDSPIRAEGDCSFVQDQVKAPVRVDGRRGVSGHLKTFFAERRRWGSPRQRSTS